jgi:large conductance mechanosensitive channel
MLDRERTFDTIRDISERGWRSGANELGGFRKFILRGNVVDLAVGIVIGAAFTSVVNSFVKDIITPLIPAAQNQSLANWTVDLPFTTAKLGIGTFMSAIISFLIVAAIVYFFIVRPITALQDRLLPKKEEEAITRACPFCLSNIPLKATRCAYCTTQLPPAE